MSAAQIYSQYLSDYEDAAKKYSRSARAFQNTTDYKNGPIRAQSTDGQDIGLYGVPNNDLNIVKQGTAEDYQNAYQAADHWGRQGFGEVIDGGNGNVSWTQREGQNPNAFRSQDGSYYKDLGNGFAAARSGGKGTGQFVTERIQGDENYANQLRESGRFKDVKYLGGGGELVGKGVELGDSAGENIYSPNSIDVTYEQMRFPDQPGEFTAKKPSLSMAQLREMANPTPTMAEAEREGVNDVGLIESARNKFMSAKPGLISSSR